MCNRRPSFCFVYYCTHYTRIMFETLLLLMNAIRESVGAPRCSNTIVRGLLCLYRRRSQYSQRYRLSRGLTFILRRSPPPRKGIPAFIMHVVVVSLSNYYYFIIFRRSWFSRRSSQTHGRLSLSRTPVADRDSQPQWKSSALFTRGKV